MQAMPHLLFITVIPSVMKSQVIQSLCQRQSGYMDIDPESASLSDVVTGQMMWTSQRM
uniref:Uncharacterized protein n=1 Tax=Octopus bimaculoides TaxID=37653 RepID=A0A0L8GY48_OCTBM